MFITVWLECPTPARPTLRIKEGKPTVMANFGVYHSYRWNTSPPAHPTFESHNIGEAMIIRHRRGLETSVQLRKAFVSLPIVGIVFGRGHLFT
jgi:hypothetical protein